MGLSSRTATALHALTILGHRRDQVVNSAAIAESLQSNPVLVRRILGALRDAGIVWASEGRGGGWSLARDPRQITLYDAYAAVEGGPVLARHPHPPDSSCVVGHNIQVILEAEFSAAERALEQRLGETTIADLVGHVLDVERTLGWPRS